MDNIVHKQLLFIYLFNSLSLLLNNIKDSYNHLHLSYSSLLQPSPSFLLYIPPTKLSLNIWSQNYILCYELIFYHKKKKKNLTPIDERVIGLNSHQTLSKIQFDHYFFSFSFFQDNPKLIFFDHFSYFHQSSLNF